MARTNAALREVPAASGPTVRAGAEDQPAEARAPDENDSKPTAADAAPATAPAPNQSPLRKRLRLILFALLPVALLAGGYWYAVGGSVMSTENAYVRADMVGVSTDVSGIVREVLVRDNQEVAKGDVLFRLDETPFRLALTRAEAAVGIVKNEIEALKASYRDMQAQIRQQQVDIDFYTREFERQQQLAAHNVSTQSNFEQAQRNLQSARQKLASLQQQLAGIAANLGGNPDVQAQAHPRYVDAVAQRDEAARQLSHTAVRAPMSGIVTNVPSLQPSQYLAASTAAVSVVATDHVWIEANPKETELTWVRPGQSALVTVDAYPGAEWHGAVDSISPASSSSFSLLPAQNTSGNWVKVVQRIPMRVRIDTPRGKPPLRSGMSVEVDVETGHERGLPTFLTGLFGGGAAARD